jgi:1,2-phenylacetyl-CoA epoxidase PaaB subunit
MARKPTDDKQRDETQWPQWEIVSIRKRGRVLGMVRAPDAETAVAYWVERYDVKDPEERRRLAAYPLTKG